jgi:hypothetical protein
LLPVNSYGNDVRRDCFAMELTMRRFPIPPSSLRRGGGERGLGPEGGLAPKHATDGGALGPEPMRRNAFEIGANPSKSDYPSSFRSLRYPSPDRPRTCQQADLPHVPPAWGLVRSPSRRHRHRRRHRRPELRHRRGRRRLSRPRPHRRRPRPRRPPRYRRQREQPVTRPAHPAGAGLTVNGTGLLCVTLLLRLRRAIDGARRSTCLPGAI